ncbi:MAG: type II toxin-antitoxin system RelE/ParE family toxin [Sulfurimonas sp.]|jgi:plasmid stabilization system protein ParE
MTIIRDIEYLTQLFKILAYIKKDKLSSAKKFEKELNNKIKALIHSPYQHRKSYYFEDEAYRDLIYIGYTVIYKVEYERILILEIFKWQER